MTCRPAQDRSAQAGSRDKSAAGACDLDSIELCAWRPVEGRESVAWVWLSSPELEFGGTAPGRAGDARTVWLHADLFGALGLTRSADPDAVRRAYRRLARLYHPDVASADPSLRDRFQEIQSASRAIHGETAVSVEPTSGTWWRFAGFSEPDASKRADLAVLGLSFEITELKSMPMRQNRDDVRISYAGQVLPLAVTYARGALTPPVLLARAAALAESTLLVLLCLAIVPALAVLLGVEMFLLSNENVFLTWGIALVTVAAGYGALAAILATAGRRIPSPRRAVFHARTVIADLRSLSGGRTS